MSAADNVHVFVWNIEWESKVKDWPYQFANADYKVVMTPGENQLSNRNDFFQRRICIWIIQTSRIFRKLAFTGRLDLLT